MLQINLFIYLYFAETPVDISETVAVS